MGKISFIIVTFNSADFIVDCLESIENLSFSNSEIIIVDNLSVDNTIEIIENTFKNVTLIKSNTNSGFVGGCNFGFQYASGEFIALINPDIILDSKWLSQMLSYAHTPEHEHTGSFASKMINITAVPHVIDTAGDGFSSILKSFKRGEGENISEFDAHEFVFGACAGAALYKRKMIEDIGFFDDAFFLLHEDSDLNVRAQLAGWKTFYVPSAIAYHKVRSSIGNMSDTSVYYSLRNSELMRIKNIPLGIFIRNLHGFIIGSIMDLIYFAIKHKNPGLYFKAKKDALKMMPAMLKKRKEIMKNRKVTNDYINQIMTSVLHKGFLMTKLKKLING